MKERSFILTSQKFIGSVLYKFGLNGFLTLFKVQADLEDKQHKYILKYLPQHINHIPQLAKLSDTLKVEEVPVDLSFQNFWKEYGNYAGKKKKCEALWEALNDAERSKCLNYLPSIKPKKAKTAPPWLIQRLILITVFGIIRKKDNHDKNKRRCN